MSQDYRELQPSDLLSDSRGYLNETADALRTAFAGAVEPAVKVAYMLWLDTANALLKQRNAANDAWIVVQVYGVAYGGLLPVAGGTMSGPIDMGGQIVSNLGLGTGLAAARVQELDLKAPIAAPVLTGDARVSQDPAGNDSIARRSWLEARYLKLAGGTLTGALVLPGNAAADLQAVPYQQLRDFVNFNVSTGHRHNGTDARKVLGTNIDSGAAIQGRPLVATGAGGSTWGSWPVSGLVLHNEPGAAIDLGVGADIPWTNEDVSAWVPEASAFAALVQFMVPSGSATVKFRLYGTAVDATAQTWTLVGATWHLAVAPIASSILNYKVDFATSGSFKLNVIGYFLTP